MNIFNIPISTVNGHTTFGDPVLILTWNLCLPFPSSWVNITKFTEPLGSICSRFVSPRSLPTGWQPDSQNGCKSSLPNRKMDSNFRISATPTFVNSVYLEVYPAMLQSSLCAKLCRSVKNLHSLGISDASRWSKLYTRGNDDDVDWQKWAGQWSISQTTVRWFS